LPCRPGPTFSNQKRAPQWGAPVCNHAAVVANVNELHQIIPIDLVLFVRRLPKLPRRVARPGQGQEGEASVDGNWIRLRRKWTCSVRISTNLA
jgi:hypothetical protein